MATALGALFAETRIPVIALTRSGQFVAANDATIGQYGFSLAELLTMNIRDLIAEDLPTLEEDLGHAYAGTTKPLERRPHKRKDGSVLWVIPTAGPITVDGETLIVSVLKDVTQIIEAEQRARDATEANLRERQLIMSAVLAMLGEREVVPALKVLARFFGSAIGRSATVWLPETPGSRRLRVVAWHNLTAEGERTIADKRLDLGRERYARLTWEEGLGRAMTLAELEPGTVEHSTVARLGPGIMAPLMGRDGPHGLILGIPREGSDLARAVALGTTLATFGGMVFEAVQLRTQLISSDRLASIGRLAAGVAHEINNPAAYVTVNLGVLRDRFRAGTARTQDVLAILDESLDGMDRIGEIMRDLKGLARERSIDLVDLGAVAQSALRMAAHETRGRARVERVAEDSAFARVRGARIAQVVLNLVLNAAQALPAGRADNRITVTTRRVGDRAIVEVSDNGPGVDPAIARRIFEPFFTTRESSGGTGLGLWLARSIVNEEGGTLVLRDAPGGGATFVVDLPAADAPREAPSAQLANDSRAGA